MRKKLNKENLTAGSYPVMEAFYSIQGEGYWSGTPAYFVRLAGCDVGCSWCDVKESWNAEDHPVWSTEEIVQRITQSPAQHVVITGGEPAMYTLAPLVDALREKKLKIHIETSGAHPLDGDWHWICLSPKKFKEPVTTVIQKADELKVIVVNKNDLLFAEKYAQLVKPECKLFLQPEWDKKEKVTPLIIDYVLKNPQWNISLQTHKYLNIP